MEYPYTEDNLIERPNSYFYSSFGGSSFLNAWRENRALVLGKLPRSKAIEWSAPSISNATAPSTLETRSFLNDLFERLTTGKSDSGDEVFLRVFVKRFEVTKRIYTHYSTSFGIVSNQEYRDLKLYIYSAAVLSEAFRIYGEWPYLNALLKMIDILVSVHPKLDARQESELALLIEIESRLVYEVLKRKGVY